MPLARIADCAIRLSRRRSRSVWTTMPIKSSGMAAYEGGCRVVAAGGRRERGAASRARMLCVRWSGLRRACGSLERPSERAPQAGTLPRYTILCFNQKGTQFDGRRRWLSTAMARIYSRIARESRCRPLCRFASKPPTCTYDYLRRPFGPVFDPRRPHCSPRSPGPKLAISPVGRPRQA